MIRKMEKNGNQNPKKKKRKLQLFLSVLAVCVLAGTIWIASSPMPIVLAVRFMMNRPAALSYPEDMNELFYAVEVVENLTYPSADGNNLYDLYLPKERLNKVPLIIWVHGGAFVAGGKSGVKNWGMALAGDGIAVAAVDYEWAPEIAYPGQLRQVTECIAQLQRQNKWNLDFEHIVLAGDSAGAHIAAQCALTATREEYAKAVKVESALDMDQIEAILLFCGLYDVEEVLNVKGTLVRAFMKGIGWAMFGQKNFEQAPLLRTANIIDYVNEDFPQTFITDGNTGSFEAHSRALAEALSKQGVQTKTLFFEKEDLETGHEYQYDLEGEAGQRCYLSVISFLEEIGWIEKPQSSTR